MPPPRDELFVSRAGTLLHLEKERYHPFGPVDGSTLLLEAWKTSTVPSFRLIVVVEGERQMEVEIFNAMGMQYHVESGAMFWPVLEDGQWEQFGFKFCDNAAKGGKQAAQQETKKCVEIFNRCIYAQLTGTQVAADDDDDDVKYMSKAGAYEVHPPSKTGATGPPVVDDEFSMSNAGATFADTGANGENTCFAESIQYHRVLVLQKRGKDTVIQAHAFGNQGLGGEAPAEFVVDGATTVKEALMQAGEQRVYLLDAAKPSADAVEGQLLELDLTSGSVVSNFQAPDTGIRSVAYLSKFASESPNVLSCISDRALFAIDTRLDPKKCVVMEEGDDVNEYKFKGKNAFTCHATSRNGYLAVGDLQGDVRFYTGTPGARKPDGAKGRFPRTAKTLISVKVPIKHIEITSDGEFVIVTTDARVLVLPTKYVDDDKNKSGFENRMGKYKPLPLALLPSPEQVHRMGGPANIRFSKATLEQNEDGEQWIAGICGSFICVWSLQKVRQSIATHEMVECEANDTGRPLTNVDLPRGGQQIAFLTKHSVGVQMRESAQEKQKNPPKAKKGFAYFSTD